MSEEPGVFEGTGATVEEATGAACAAAGLAPEQAVVEVISEGGMAAPGERIARALARVRVIAMPAEAVRGKALLEDLLRRMGIEVQVRVRRLPEAPAAADAVQVETVLLEVDGTDLGVLIGWRGESLLALQTVFNLMLGEVGLAPGAARLIIDIARYRQRREQAVAQMAQRMAAGVARTGRPVTLDPMPPYERRAIHLALAGDRSITTESVGADADRRVTIRPADGSRA